MCHFDVLYDGIAHADSVFGSYMFKILDLYIIRNFIVTFIFMVMMISLIVVVIDFSERLDDFINKQVPFSVLATVYYPQLVVFLTNMLSPICIFLAVILFTSRMAQNTEIVAMLSGGMSFYRLLLPYVFMGTVLGGASFYLNAYIVPQSVIIRNDFEYQYMRSKNPFEKRNIHKKVDKNTFITLYAYNQYDQTAENFVLEHFTDNKLTFSIHASAFKWKPKTQSWEIINGKYRYFSTDGKEKLIEKATFDTTFMLKPDDIYQRSQYAESLNLSELEDYIEKERLRGSDILEDLILEKYERYAYPFAAIILTLIGVSLSSKKSRGGTALQLGIGLVLSFVYVFILLSAKVAISDYFPHWLAIWLPNIIFSIIALILIRIAPK